VPRSYGQYCAIAKTLDLIGDRWTLLVIRELVFGPKRYTDVLSGLPGMNTTLLAQRLRDLESDGIVRRRTLPPPAASTVYELTDAGIELAWALLPLVHWGARYALGDRSEGEYFRVEWPLLVMAASLDPERIADLRATYEFRVDGSTAHIEIHSGSARVVSGPAAEPDVVLTTDVETFVGVGTGRLGPVEMAAAGRLDIDGTVEAAATFAALITGLGAPAWGAPRPDVAVVPPKRD
jgi:DNA-binding HxlR family transcriptional regulator